MSVYQNEVSKLLKHLLLKYETQVTQLKNKSVGLDQLSILEIHLLEYLSNDREVTQKDLVNGLDFKRAKSEACVKRLLKARLIKKVINPKDKRSNWVVLSESGKKLLKSYQFHEDAFVTLVLKDMTVNEEKTIVKFLSKINQTDYLK